MLTRVFWNSLSAKLLTKWSLFCIVVVLLGGFLRFTQYAQIPVAGETQDEVAWSLLGGSLLQTGTPTSWSHFSPYADRNAQTEPVTWAGNYFQLVTPAVDHPPLFSLLPGAAITAAGYPWKQLPSITLIRFPMVLLGTLNLALFVWWLNRLPIDRTWRVVSALIFATAPSWVLISRLVVSENLLQTWLLLILLTLSWEPQTRRARQLHTAAIVLLHAALPLTKVSGLALGIGSVIVLWFSAAPWKSLAKPAAAGTALGVTALLAYMAMYDFGLFIAVQTQQSQRGVGLLTLYTSQLLSLVVVKNLFSDAWNLLGFGALFAWLMHQPSQKTLSPWHRYTSVVALALLGFTLISVGEYTLHGWYRIPFYPLMALALGWVASTLLQHRAWWGLAIVWLLMSIQLRAGLLAWLGSDFTEHQETWQRLWSLAAGGVVLAGLKPLRPAVAQRVFILIGAALLAITVASHILTITQLTQVSYWEDDQFLQTGE